MAFRGGMSQALIRLSMLRFFCLLGCAFSLACATRSAALRDPALNRSCQVPTSALGLATPVDLLGGVFALTMVSERRWRRDIVARGRLWLWRTSAQDRSPRSSAVPAPGDTARAPFYGVTSVDRRALIPYLRRTPVIPADTIPPPVDPLYPHVLARDNRRVGRDGPYRELELLVGTVNNRRESDGLIGLDGSGIVLHVQQMDSSAFGGTWGGYGITDEGRGRYCATRIR